MAIWIEISKMILCTYDVERVLNWRSVVHRSEEMMLNREDHALLQEFVTHHELLA